MLFLVRAMYVLKSGLNKMAAQNGNLVFTVTIWKLEMIIFWTQFLSSFQMVISATLFLTIRKPDQFLDHST